MTVIHGIRTRAVAASPTVSPARPGERRLADPLHAAIVRAVAYADVFDAPLGRSRVLEALDVEATPGSVQDALDHPAWATGILDIGDEDVTIAGRGDLRLRSAAHRAVARRRWPAARAAGRLIGALPFVRMVAVSGSLAVDASDADADVDLFVVTDDGRLWLARRLIVGVVRLFALARIRLCPNYLLTRSALALDDRTLFVAHELAQLVPVAGHELHSTLVRRNGWAVAWLPNAFPVVTVGDGTWAGTATGGAAADPGAATAAAPEGAEPDHDRRAGGARRVMERALRARPFDRLERWELERMRRRYPADPADAGEARFDADRCKGHLVPNGRRAMDAYAARIAQLGAGPTGAAAGPGGRP